MDRSEDVTNTAHADFTSSDDAYPMTAAQQRVLRAMDPSAGHLEDVLPTEGASLWRVVLGVGGVGLILAGTVLVFFFAAAGAVMLGVGGLSFIAALQGVPLAEKAAQSLGALADDDSSEPPTTH